MSTIEVTRVRGAALLQDSGRRGHMHEGVPRGGALVPELLACANLALGNRWDAPALEVFGALTVVACEGAPRLATEAGALDARDGADGATWEIARARYVAIAGGFDVPLILDGRGALPSVGIGAWLARGARLRAAVGASLARDVRTRVASFEEGAHAAQDDDPIRVVRGPDVDRFEDSAWLELVASAFAITAVTDRVGTRLRGAPLAHRGGARGDADARSMPMTRGAIQVPPSGEPIVLGPDHPTTGGYPVIATVIRADLGRFAMRATRGTGSEAVRFRELSVELAREAWREHRARHGMLP